MSGYYIDLWIIDTEIDRNYILSKLYDKLHLYFVEILKSEGKVPIGIGFPDYLEYSKKENPKNFFETQNKKNEDLEEDECEFKKKEKGLGSRIRLFSPNQDSLKDARLKHIFDNMKQYLHISDMRPVSNRCSEYVIYKRFQPEPNIERLAKRKAKRANISIAEAILQLKKDKPYKREKIENIPYVNMRSRSSDNYFKLFIQECAADNFSYVGFNSYGLSNFSTIPKF